MAHAKEFFPKSVLKPVLEIWNFSAKCFAFVSKVWERHWSCEKIQNI